LLGKYLAILVSSRLCGLRDLHWVKKYLEEGLLLGIMIASKLGTQFDVF
jgi:hypothetical protein